MGKVLVPEDPAHFSHLGHPNVSKVTRQIEFRQRDAFYEDLGGITLLIRLHCFFPAFG